MSELYATPGRLAARSELLRRSRVDGADPVRLIVDLLRTAGDPGVADVLEVGCGRGRVAATVTSELRPRSYVAVDSSRAMLEETARRAGASTIRTIHADFHALHLPAGAFDAAIAAFCLYHSPHPESVCAELARCLRPGGLAVFATKSADSYHELDGLITAARLEQSVTVTNLYETFDSANAAGVVATAFRVESVRHDRHLFQLHDPDDAARFLWLSPTHRWSDEITVERLTEAFRSVWSGAPVAFSSRVTVLSGRLG